MEAGKMNTRITIQTATDTVNANKTKTTTWADSFSVYSEMVTNAGGIFYAAQKLNYETQAVFRVRYTTRITRKNRIKLGDRIFTILHINPVDKKELQISAKEVI
jgi:SPP1 family predicted phage head-tail adaptor